MSSEPDALPDDIRHPGDFFYEVRKDLLKITPQNFKQYRQYCLSHGPLNGEVDGDRLDRLAKAGVPPEHRQRVMKALLDAAFTYYEARLEVAGLQSLAVVAAGEPFLNWILAPAYKHFDQAVKDVSSKVRGRVCDPPLKSRLPRGIALRLLSIRRNESSALIKEGAIDHVVLRSPVQRSENWSFFARHCDRSEVQPRENRTGAPNQRGKKAKDKVTTKPGPELVARREGLRKYIEDCLTACDARQGLLTLFDQLCTQSHGSGDELQLAKEFLSTAGAARDKTDLAVIAMLLRQEIYNDGAGDLQAHSVDVKDLDVLLRSKHGDYDVATLIQRLSLIKARSGQQLTLATRLGYYRYVLVAHKDLLSADDRSLDDIWKRGVRLASRVDHFAHWTPPRDQWRGIVVKLPLDTLVRTRARTITHVQCETFGQALLFAQQAQCAAVVPDIALTERDSDLHILADLLPHHDQQVSLYGILKDLCEDSDKFIEYKLLAESMALQLCQRRAALAKVEPIFRSPTSADQDADLFAVARPSGRAQ